MKDSLDIQCEISAVKAVHALAEHSIKAAEVVTLTPMTAAINELRLAGFHLLRAMEAKDEGEAIQQLRSAKAHSHRAIRDSSEMLARDSLGRLKEIRSRLRFIDIDDRTIQGLADAQKISEELQALLIERRTAGGGEDEYQQMVALSAKAARLLTDIDRDPGGINILVRAAKRRAQLFIALSFLGLLASVGIYVVEQPGWRASEEGISVSNEIENLDSIGKSLKDLQVYVSDQKAGLQKLHVDVESLQAEKEQLDRIVGARREAVDAVLAKAQEVAGRHYWRDQVVAFSMGIFSSLLASLLWAFAIRMKKGLYAER